MFNIVTDNLIQLGINNYYMYENGQKPFKRGVTTKQITPYTGFDLFIVQTYNPETNYSGIDYFTASFNQIDILLPSAIAGAAIAESPLYNASFREYSKHITVRDYYEPWTQAVISSVPYDFTGSGV